jgi:hypothetical protein
MVNFVPEGQEAIRLESLKAKEFMRLQTFKLPSFQASQRPSLSRSKKPGANDLKQ